MLAPWLVTAALLASPAPAPQDTDAREALGRGYLAALELPDLPPRYTVSGRSQVFLDMLRDRHHTYDLGAIQLWVPDHTLRKNGTLASGTSLEPARAWTADLMQLQARWIELIAPKNLKAERRADLELVDKWLRARLRGRTTLGEAEAIELDRARASLRNSLSPLGSPSAPVILITPTRLHHVALCAATGVLFRGERERLWQPGVLVQGSSYLLADVIALPLEGGPDPGSDGLKGMSYSSEDSRTAVVHRGAHFLIDRTLDRGPPWLLEGLALSAGIDLTGIDDSPCSGFWARDHMANMVWLPNWIEADTSPYREGPSGDYFEKLLRPDKQGRFAIFDLDRGKLGAWVEGPFLPLAHTDELPKELLNQGRGLERGYAEFRRAYTGTFVHWLSLQRVGDRSVLDWLVDFLGDRGRHGGVPPEQLAATGLRMITLKTLGESEDPDRDLEAAFQAWLAAR